MSSPHKPRGYTTVSPYLIVDGASHTIEFLVRVFDAVELRRFPDSSGKLMHAEVCIDDVDATYRRALAASATSVQEPVKKGDEDKRG